MQFIFPYNRNLDNLHNKGFFFVLSFNILHKCIILKHTSTNVCDELYSWKGECKYSDNVAIWDSLKNLKQYSQLKMGIDYLFKANCSLEWDFRDFSLIYHKCPKHS